MPSTLIRVYGRFDEAQRVREQLLAAGIPPSHVHLSSNDDEAGAVQGNFYTGDAAGGQGVSGGRLDGADDAHDYIYERDFARVVKRGNYLLVVDAEDEEQASRVSDIIERMGDSGEGERLNGRHH